MSASTFGVLLLLLGAFCTDVFAVKITNLRVPEYIVLEADGPDHVILDCEYELEKEDKNFVLKWFQDNNYIYQWIFGAKPTAFPSMKGKINDSYEVSSDKFQRYRALVLLNPSKDSAGEYKCLIQDMNSVDSESEVLRVFDLRNYSVEVQHKTIGDEIEVTCEVKNVFPRPTLRIRWNEGDVPIKYDNYEKGDDGLYDAHVTASLTNDGIYDTDIINCILGFNHTNFTRIHSAPFSGSTTSHICIINVIFSTVFSLLFSLVFTNVK